MALANRLCSVSSQLTRSLAAFAGGLPEKLLKGATPWSTEQRRCASKKQGGSTQNGKDSNPKMLGIKLRGGQPCRSGNIIVRQRGTEFHPGENVGLGRDHTIFALADGLVKYSYHNRTKRRTISVIPRQITPDYRILPVPTSAQIQALA